MEPKNESGPIPTGWTLLTEVLPDGSIVAFYYCPSTGKRFYSYSDLMCYVNYAKKTKLGLYALGTELLKRKRTENDTTPVPEPKKTSTILSLPKDSKCYSSSGDDSSSDDLLSDDSSSDDSSSEDSSSDDSSSDDLSSDDSSSDDSSSDDDSNFLNINFETSLSTNMNTHNLDLIYLYFLHLA
ncbi:hypothetical protein D0Y65_005772 [Glycine soja]|uniref:MBD domain-containing protein n=1 Tax=Glycine soja TaxID=3848 RepID=A0A445L6C2_GLYSO|nr:hypothetical protein D0Y65_005772 [Glycine soja]